MSTDYYLVCFEKKKYMALCSMTASGFGLVSKNWLFYFLLDFAGDGIVVLDEHAINNDDSIDENAGWEFINSWHPHPDDAKKESIKHSDDGAIWSDGSPTAESFLEAYRQSGLGLQAQTREWVNNLRANGVKAAHPNDGWIDRVNGIASLRYPQFDDGLSVGDMLALGQAWDKEPTIIVTITEVRKDMFGRAEYKFEGYPK